MRSRLVCTIAAESANEITWAMPPLGQYVCLFEEAGMCADRGSLPPIFRP